MTIVGYTMLHYGCDYLADALLALHDYVDRHVIIYSPTPTFGSQTTLRCPDSRDDLRAIADSVLGKKLLWVEGAPQNYNTVRQVLPATKLILETDADEVWPLNLIARVLRLWRDGELTHDRYRMPMIHHWRSFGFVCRDQSWPIRLGLFNRQVPEPIPWLYSGSPINHFGYARSLADMRYKIDTSAHKGEWRAGWWENKFLPWTPDADRAGMTDLHPVAVNLWNAEPYDRQSLPQFMRKHPNFDKAVIA